MTDEYLVAVDVGTSGVKALAVSAAGVVLQEAWRAYALHHPHPGYAEQEPAALLSCTREVIQTVRAAVGKAPLAISWSSAMHGMLAVDATGQPLTPLITWADSRSISQTKEVIGSGVADAIFRAGGTPIHPMTPLCKLLWLRQQAPAVFQAAHKFVSIKELILFQLTRQWQVDFSIASATALFHTRHLRWHDDALRLADINVSKLSDPVPTTFTATIQTDWLGREWRGIPLVYGASDGCLAQLGSGATEPDALAITIGTSAAVREMVPAFTAAPGKNLFCYYLNEGQYVRGGASNNGTAAIDWCQRTFSPGATGLDDFANELERCAAGADGLVCLPYLFGERSPHYNPHARGVFWGMTASHGTAHFQRAVGEGICFAVKSIVIEVCSRPPDSIRLSGGFSRSAMLVQLLADVLQQPVQVAHTPEASAMGAAILGFAALGAPVRWATAPAMTCYPEAQTAAVYARQFEVYQSLYRQLEPLFETSFPPA
jgi:gluconokinase